MSIRPSMAWLAVFLPALSYWLATRLQSSGFRWGRSYRLGDAVTEELWSLATAAGMDACLQLAQVFHLTTACTQPTTTTTSTTTTLKLQYTLNRVHQGRGLRGPLVASTWHHDAELGRGYLLVAQASGNGRVWRWEVGGGPIAIGKTLHLDASGCRSNQYRKCQVPQQQQEQEPVSSFLVGSGAMAIDFHGQERASQGALVVAEWGEGRIVRMEQTTGARTPLIMNVPDLCVNNGGGQRRIHQPHAMLYTPFGDLLVATNDQPSSVCNATAAIYRLKRAMHVPPLESLEQSRHAHAWKELPTNTNHKEQLPDVWLQDNLQKIGGMAIDPTWLGLYVTATHPTNGHVVLLRVAITDADEDHDKDEKTEKETQNEQRKQNTQHGQELDNNDSSSSSATTHGAMDGTATVLLDLTKALGISTPGPIAVSAQGPVFVGVPEGIAILAPPGTSATHVSRGVESMTVLGILPLAAGAPTSLTLGEDKFLYALADNSIFRIPVRVHPVAVPTNLVLTKDGPK